MSGEDVLAGKRQSKTILLGLLGAAAGGIAGYFAFFWIVRQGLYALVLPPALLGIGAGLAARERSAPLAVICAVAGLALGLFIEWRFEPFIDDGSFAYFITHIPELRPFTLVSLALGAFLGYRLPLSFARKS